MILFKSFISDISYIFETYLPDLKQSLTLNFTDLLPNMPITCWAATKVLHFCLYFAIFSIVPQVLFNDFRSPSTSTFSMCSLNCVQLQMFTW